MTAPAFRTSLLLLVLILAAGDSFGQAVSPRLEAMVAAARSDAPHLVWVYLREKGDTSARLGEAQALLSVRARERRKKRGRGALVRFADIPPVSEYVDAVRERVSGVRHVSRWLNAVSVEATGRQIEELQRLPFVKALDAVRRYSKGADEQMVSMSRSRSLREAPSALDLDYGNSFGQLEQINVPAMHALGLDGEGVLIAVFDTGFKNLRHEAFSHLDILARWDFVNGDSAVGNNGDMGDGGHGAFALSIIGGYSEGELIGPAHRATYLLAKTENTESETPVEEDNWVAAVEWAEAWGADVITSSLGYLSFDPPFPGYSFEDMDGETAVTTRAAQMAAERGIVVVTSAGNGGFAADLNTLGAPADGKLVLSIGAVDAFGARADFSSVGRTADGRIKPDVMAQGVLVKGIDTSTPNQYALSSGTSFSCPLAAGVVALLLQAHPEWNVMRVRRALRSTANNAASPTRLVGWGILDGVAALRSH